MRLCKAFRQSRRYGNITGLEICGGTRSLSGQSRRIGRKNSRVTFSEVY